MAWKRNEPESPETPSYAPRPESQPAPAGGRRERAVIGASITIHGDLSGEEDLTIHGRVEGKVDVKGNSVTIGESGRVKADVYADTIFVEGEVEGNLYGGNQIVLRSSGNVRGNLTAPRVALDDGAQFKGSIDMEPKRQGAAGRAPAPSTGRAEERPGAGGTSPGSGSGSGSASGPGSASGSGGGSAGTSGSSGESSGESKAAAGQAGG